MLASTDATNRSVPLIVMSKFVVKSVSAQITKAGRVRDWVDSPLF